MPRITVTNASENGEEVFLEGMGDAARLVPGDSIQIDFEGGQALAFGASPGEIDDLKGGVVNTDNGGFRPRGEEVDYEGDDGTARAFRKRRQLDAEQDKPGDIPAARR